MTSGFNGFTKQTVKFWQELKKNNNKTWFDQNRDLYDEHVVAPAREFVAAMGAKLKKIAPDILAIPKVNKSLFRINRDTRFSHDKSPYKTHMGLWLWEGAGKRMESSGLYFHLEPPGIMLGVGLHVFPKNLLDVYRAAVDDGKTGAALTRIVTKIESAGDYGVGGEHYKRVPRGFDPDHKRGDLLRHNGLAAAIQSKIPQELYSPALVDWCLERYRVMAPLHRWLRDNVVAKAGKK
ncbi:MAG: DUF2461 domain-containing protein [Proteobacteria bacterium]|nr:DUF2461 domain-containing protein [Pseudomonadota bacterium]MBU1740074.1 DUF2461 domain-containing protein [Pseudomonadota bacterium]